AERVGGQSDDARPRRSAPNGGEHEQSDGGGTRDAAVDGGGHGVSSAVADGTRRRYARDDRPGTAPRSNRDAPAGVASLAGWRGHGSHERAETLEVEGSAVIDGEVQELAPPIAVAIQVPVGELDARAPGCLRREAHLDLARA